jgi:Tfp pilus assembly protein PilX
MNFDSKKTSTLLTTERKNQRGAALVTAIFAILLATLIGFALHYSAYVSQAIAINDRDNTEALYLADAGISHATALISKVASSDFSKILAAGANPTPGTGDELSVPPIADLWSTSEAIPAGNKTSGGVTGIGAGGAGRYWVTVKNDAATGETETTDKNGILILTSTGVGRNGATATIEAIYYAKSVNLPAVLTNGKTKIAGSVRVQGDNGILHSNDTLRIDGAPCADQYFSTSTDIINPSKLKGTNCSGSGFNRFSQPLMEPPILNIRDDFYGKTTFTLGAIGTQAGKVYSGSGTLLADTSKTGNKWTNTDGSTWIWDSGKALWIQSGNKVTNGSYYSEGNIAITGNFGNPSTPARVSFIAEGFIYNQGKQNLAPSYQNYTLIAGTDIKLSGKFSETEIADLELEGFTYAHHQIDFSGTPTLRGSVVAANQGDTASPGGINLVPLDSGWMKISGNPTIISDTGVVFTFGSQILSWREVRY